jgi:hypothetical protein
MTTITTTFGRLWIPALLVVLVTSTVANAETRIGTAQSVKPDASGSVAGTLSAGSGVLPLAAGFTQTKRLKPEAPARRACSLMTRAT